MHMWAIEVGCKGFPATSMASFLKDIGIAGGERNRQLKKIGEVAMTSSRRIWNWSHFTQCAQWDNQENGDCGFLIYFSAKSIENNFFHNL